MPFSIALTCHLWDPCKNTCHTDIYRHAQKWHITRIDQVPWVYHFLWWTLRDWSESQGASSWTSLYWAVQGCAGDSVSFYSGSKSLSNLSLNLLEWSWMRYLGRCHLSSSVKKPSERIVGIVDRVYSTKKITWRRLHSGSLNSRVKTSLRRVTK